MTKKKLRINGQNVEVSEEVYKAYMQEEWREGQRRYRSWRCRNGKGVRCKARCEECPYYRLGNSPKGSDVSIEGMMEEEDSNFDIPDLTTDVEVEVAQNILHEELFKARTALSEREQEVFDMLFEGRSERDIAARLGVTPSRAHTIKDNLFKKLRGILSAYADFFRG